jgi:hypothetical protein
LKALKEVAAKHEGALKVEIVFAGEHPGEATANMKLAAGIPGAEARWVTAKEAARQFDAHTSGQTFVFHHGRQVYAGGITPSRGTDQPRFALEIFDGLLGGNPLGTGLPVFGCPLGEPQ